MSLRASGTTRPASRRLAAESERCEWDHLQGWPAGRLAAASSARRREERACSLAGLPTAPPPAESGRHCQSRGRADTSAPARAAGHTVGMAEGRSQRDPLPSRLADAETKHGRAPSWTHGGDVCALAVREDILSATTGWGTISVGGRATAKSRYLA